MPVDNKMLSQLDWFRDSPEVLCQSPSKYHIIRNAMAVDCEVLLSLNSLTLPFVHSYSSSLEL